MLHKNSIRLRFCTAILGMVVSSGCQTCKTIQTVDATYAARIVVVGEVGQPGEFPIVTEATTLTQALRLCGGIVRPGMRSGNQTIVGTQSESPTALAEVETFDRRQNHKPLDTSFIERVSFSSLQQQGTTPGISPLPTDPSTTPQTASVVPAQEGQPLPKEVPKETLLIGIQRRGANDIFYFPERLVAASPDLIGRIRLFHGDTVSVIAWNKTGLDRELFKLSNDIEAAPDGYTVVSASGLVSADKVTGKLLTQALGSSEDAASVVVLTRQSAGRLLHEHFVHSLDADDGLTEVWKTQNIVPLDHFQYTILGGVPIVASHLLAPELGGKQSEILAGPHVATVLHTEKRHCASVDNDAVCNTLWLPLAVAEKSASRLWSKVHRSRVQQSSVPIPSEAFTIDPTLGDLQLQQQTHHDRKMSLMRENLGVYSE